jgi:hypothetical protein
MRILPGRSIKSPSIQSSLSLHGSSNSNDGAAESVDVQGAHLDSIERSVNGRSKSSGAVQGKGMGSPGKGTEGMSIALRMLLTNLQSVSACKFKGFAIVTAVINTHTGHGIVVFLQPDSFAIECGDRRMCQLM